MNPKLKFLLIAYASLLPFLLVAIYLHGFKALVVYSVITAIAAIAALLIPMKKL